MLSARKGIIGRVGWGSSSVIDMGWDMIRVWSSCMGIDFAIYV